MVFGNAAAAKLGILLGFAWVLIFTGCLMNIGDVFAAVLIAAIIWIIVFGLVFTAGRWVPDLIEGLNRKDDD